MLAPAGPAAAAIAPLWWAMLAGSAGILLLVCVLLALAFRRKRDDREPSVRTWIIGGGIAFPVVVLTALLGFGLIVGERLLPHRDPQTVRVAAEASRWQWTFAQPGVAGPIRSEGILHIPAGRPVDVELTTLDVIHSFWVPRLAGKMDAIPGHRNVLRIEADEPGTYFGLCTEYCGTGHSRHGFSVVAHDAAGWARFRKGPRS